MASKLSPHFIELVYDALLKSFWRKKALRNFLRRSHVSENFLGQLTDDESKRDWLDRLFRRLEELLFRGVVVTSYGFVCLLLVTRERVARGSQRAHTLWAGKTDRLRAWLHG